MSFIPPDCLAAQDYNSRGIESPINFNKTSASYQRWYISTTFLDMVKISKARNSSVRI